jgi:hypothetical protein
MENLSKGKTNGVTLDGNIICSLGPLVMDYPQAAETD